MQHDPALIPVAFAELPGWEEDDQASALAAFCRSAHCLAERQWPDAARGRLNRLIADAQAFNARGDGTAHAARKILERHCVPHRIVHGGPAGLVTGYFEPVLKGSRRRTETFRVPVYRRPPDLVNLVDDSARGSVGASYTHARASADGPVPYFTRVEIEAGALDGLGLELLYLADPVDTFFMHVQGSGCIELDDGSTVRLAYDGKNGHPYTSVGRYLIDSGAMTAAEMSLAAMGSWLRVDEERGRLAMQVNRSFVFFRELAGGAAASALGVKDIILTPGRSLAVDASVHAIGQLVHVSAPTLVHAGRADGFHRLMIAQDVGSAITGPERGDIYFGSGEEAGRLAGSTKHAAAFHVLLPRDEAGQ